MTSERAEDGLVWYIPAILQILFHSHHTFHLVWLEKNQCNFIQENHSLYSIYVSLYLCIIIHIRRPFLLDMMKEMVQMGRACYWRFREKVNMVTSEWIGDFVALFNQQSILKNV